VPTISTALRITSKPDGAFLGINTVADAVGR